MGTSVLRYVAVFLAVFCLVTVLAQASEPAIPPPPEFQGSFWAWINELWSWLNTYFTGAWVQPNDGADAIIFGGTPRFQSPT